MSRREIGLNIGEIDRVTSEKERRGKMDVDKIERKLEEKKVYIKRVFHVR